MLPVSYLCLAQNQRISLGIANLWLSRRHPSTPKTKVCALSSLYLSVSLFAGPSHSSSPGSITHSSDSRLDFASCLHVSSCPLQLYAPWSCAIFLEWPSLTYLLPQVLANARCNVLAHPIPGSSFSISILDSMSLSVFIFITHTIDFGESSSLLQGGRAIRRHPRPL